MHDIHTYVRYIHRAELAYVTLSSTVDNILCFLHFRPRYKLHSRDPGVLRRAVRVGEAYAMHAVL